ncbi:MAG: cryptochrome/photolyase family protein [Verrucomicrobiota bacterium]
MATGITLVFPHQLFRKHPSLKKGRPIWLIEDTLLFGDPHARPGKFHQQKILLHRASMKAWAAEREKAGYTVSYFEYDRELPLDLWLEKQHRAESFEELHLADPVDYLIERRLNRFASKAEVSLQVSDSPMFLTPPDWAEEQFSKRKKPFMASFYEAQRKRMGILIDKDDEPTGGRWSFDDENRLSMPKKGLDVPDLPHIKERPEVEEAREYVAANFSDYPGIADQFAYPVRLKDAEAWLDHFLEWRFDRFGPYEDALSDRERVLFHSVLTPMMNIGLLTPEEVLERALEYAAENEVPLNSLEGFVRQIIGWREFMWLMYRRHGVEMRTRNFFEHTRQLPDTFWTAETGVEPLDLVISRARDHAYSHHIERLMVMGNFMLLGGYDPDCVYDWFMEFYIDAYDWVMVPNVYGMSQFADGGIFTTKPYISGSNYVKKMSDYGKGPWCETWDGLFWSFIEQHYDFFKGQYRLAMMARNLDKMSDEKRAGHQKAAAAFLED